MVLIIYVSEVTATFNDRRDAYAQALRACRGHSHDERPANDLAERVLIRLKEQAPGAATAMARSAANREGINAFRTKLLGRLHARGRRLAQEGRLMSEADESLGRSFGLVPVLEARLSNETIDAVLDYDEVDGVEPDCTVTISQQQLSPPWGLDRIDSCFPSCQANGLPNAPARDQTFNYGAASGAGVNVYVLDSALSLSLAPRPSRTRIFPNLRYIRADVVRTASALRSQY